MGEGTERCSVGPTRQLTEGRNELCQPNSLPRRRIPASILIVDCVVRRGYYLVRLTKAISTERAYSTYPKNTDLPVGDRVCLETSALPIG